MAITVYRSDDTSAPLLTPTDGSFNALLKACLVDGYGSKLAAGWTMPYDDLVNGKSIFQNTTSKKLWVLHNGSSTTNSAGTTYFRYAFMRGIEGYTDFDTTTGNYPNIIGDPNTDFTTAAFQAPSILLSDSESFSSGIKWFVIADDKTFYMWIGMGSYNDGNLDPSLLDLQSSDVYQTTLIGFGDYDKLANSATNGILIGCSKTAAPTYSNMSFQYASKIPTSTSSFVCYLQRNANGDVGAVEYSTYPRTYFDQMSKYGADVFNKLIPYIGTTQYYMKSPNKFNKYFTSEIDLYQRINAPEHGGTISYQDALVGSYRGVYQFMHSIDQFAEHKSPYRHGDEITIDARDYLVLAVNPIESATAHTCLIDLTGWA